MFIYIVTNFDHRLSWNLKVHRTFRRSLSLSHFIFLSNTHSLYLYCYLERIYSRQILTAEREIPVLILKFSRTTTIWLVTCPLLDKQRLGIKKADWSRVSDDQTAGKRTQTYENSWPKIVFGGKCVCNLGLAPGERPGACSGLRSGAWPWKRNNGRLGAFN